MKELTRLMKHPVEGIQLKVDSHNTRYLHVLLDGPIDTPYADGKFQLEMFLTDEYPMAAPKLRFLTRVYHPNIDYVGRICLDILKDKWSPALQIRTVLLSVQALLSAPNPDDPLNNEAAELWNKNLEQALNVARQFTVDYATLPTDGRWAPIKSQEAP